MTGDPTVPPSVRLSVIIPTRDRFDKLRKVLDALERQQPPPQAVEIVVVDDGSADGTPARAAAFGGRLPLKVVSQPNKGPAAARNTGVRAASGELVLFLNDDMYPATDLLARHLAHHARPGDRAVLGNVDWQPPVSDFMAFLSPDGPMFKHGRLVDGQPATFDFFCTGNISLPRRWLLLEPFDETLPYAAYEDSEVGYRLIERRGFELVYCATAVVYHDHPQTLRSYQDKITRDGRTAFVLFEKYRRVPEGRRFLRRYFPYLMIPAGSTLFFAATWLLSELRLAYALGGRRAWWFFSICHHHVRGYRLQRRQHGAAGV